nr:hypothetical protein [Tanacetum cinerariifolium]
MTLLNTLIETCTTLSHKVAAFEKDKVTQALEIFKLKRRVKRLEKKRRSKHSGLKMLMKLAIDADEDITRVDIETKVDLGPDLQGRIERKDDDNVANKEVNATEPTIFNDEEVTMTMAQTLIKMKAEKARILDEQMPKRLHDEEESFKKLKAVEVSGCESTQDTPTNDTKEMSEEDVKNMLEIVPVTKFKVEALQVKYPLIDWEIHPERSKTYWKIIRVGGITQEYQSFEDMLKDFDREDLDALWRLVKDKLSSTVPKDDKEKVLWVELKRLFKSDADDVI